MAAAGENPKERADPGSLEQQSGVVGESQNNGSATAATQEPTPDFPAGELVAEMRGYLRQNKAWSQKEQERDPDFFKALQDLQSPAVMWIGCAETRVPANELLGVPPGEVFVQRNVGNIVNHKDFNCMSCLEYAVKGLKVRHVMVCGHYGCGLVNLWLNDVRSIRDKHADTLRQLRGKDTINKLVELNVVRQVFNVCTSPIVQKAWDLGQPLAVHGLVYDIADGILKPIGAPVTCLEDLDRYSLDQMDTLRHLSLSVLEQGSFEQDALVWEGQKKEALRYPSLDFD
ncbi:hypothetical protein N2152v2_009979 [Parachlorella kessleri]